MTSSPDAFALPGRILFLSANAATVAAQLGGQTLTREQVGELRDDVSTDEITPVAILSHYDNKLGRYPYTGFTVEGQRPIGPDAIRLGGFSVTVAGKRYGKGSSREHSPAAEKLAGIRLVIAESFERLYRQNADNIGLFTSTDFGLIERIQRGELISVDELVAPRDALAAAVLRQGGLLRFGQAHLSSVHAGASGNFVQAKTPQTLFEKIIARHALRTALIMAGKFLAACGVPCVSLKDERISSQEAQRNGADVSPGISSKVPASGIRYGCG